jgi:hypothetical protein
MSTHKIELVLDCQTDLLAAIERQDADALVRASENLSAAISQLGDARDWPDFEPASNRLRLALEQNRAALQRLNLMRHWTRQRIDRLNELRSGNQDR